MPPLSDALGAILRQELAPVPGRITTLWRYLIASAIVVTISMALQIPFLALSLIVLFSTTLQNTYLTRLSGLLASVGLTLAAGCTVLLLRTTFDLALPRILGAMAILFAAMYFMRTSKLGAIGFLVAMMVVYVQSEVDTVHNPELLVRAVLWVWVAVTYPIAVNILVGYLLPASAEDHLRTELRGQLERIASGIEGMQGAQAPEQSFLRMRRQLAYALREHPDQTLQNVRGKARVRLVERLLVASSHLAGAGLRQQGHAPPLLAAIRALQVQIKHDTPFEMPSAPWNAGADTPAPLAAMHAAFIRLAQEEAPREDSPHRAAPDAGTGAGLNMTACQFALKVVLATQLGYLLFSAVQWPGIHTCMLTCIILALPGLGAITHKGVLRLAGAALGSTAALLATVFVIPHLDSITGLLLLCLAVIAVGAWIAAGSPLTDYVGFQLVFCFALALLGKFGPNTDLTEIRDRAVGIVLGVLISLLVYGQVWPEREGGQSAGAIADLLRKLSSVAATCGAADEQEYEQARADAWSAIEQGRQLQMRLAFEPRRVSPRRPEWPLDDVLGCMRRMLLDFDWLAMQPAGSLAAHSAVLAAAGASAAERLRNMAAYTAAMPPARAPVIAHGTPHLPDDELARTAFVSIDHALTQLQQYLIATS